MKLLIYIEQSKIFSLMKDPLDENPGIGGTTYTAARLALELNNKYINKNSNIEVFLLSENSSFNKFHGIKIFDLNNSQEEFFDYYLITGDMIDYFYRNRKKYKSKNIISWIRHPYDFDKIKKSKKLNARIVSVGRSQYISNLLISGPHNHIDNLFCAARVRSSLSQIKRNKLKSNKSRSKNIKYFTVGFMGALVPSKGFHLIAKEWQEIVNYCLKNNLIAKLEVIGGANLYDFKESHKDIPTSHEYGEIIAQFINKEINNTVIFHGTLGRERFNIMSRCDIAIVNPNGNGEAFPASILEWMALGVPVISSLRFECSDAMKYIDVLSISSSKQLLSKIKYFVNLNEKEKENLKDLSNSIANLFSSKQESIINEWILLLKNPKLKINEYTSFKITNLIIKDYVKIILKRILKLIFK